MPTMQPKLVLRDVAVLVLAAALWWWEARTHAEGGLVATIVAVAAGTLTGVCGYYLHEWGHLLGALTSGGVVRFPNRIASPLLFDFDVQESTRRQFLAMSYGGYVGSVLGLLLCGWLLPFDRLSGQVALGWVVLGTLASVALEAPTTYRVARGAAPPEALLRVAPPAPSSPTDG